jgi:thioredoxin 1
MMNPIVEQFSNAYGNVSFYRVDVDNLSDVSNEMGITAMPAFYFFKNGQKLDSHIGADPTGLKVCLPIF